MSQRANNGGGGRRPPPTEWEFNERDREHYENVYWRCPATLATDRVLSFFWRPALGQTSGGGVVSSLLPVLALHVKHTGGAWSDWTTRSYRRLATLAGVNKSSVRPALDWLRTFGLLEMEKRPRADGNGGPQVAYRLSGGLFGTIGSGEPNYVEIHGGLIYGGAWALLPSNAARHLYLALAAFDPVKNETAYIERARGFHDWVDLSTEGFTNRAEHTAYRHHRLSLRELVRAHGVDYAIREAESIEFPCIGDAVARAILDVRREEARPSRSALMTATGLSRSVIPATLEMLSDPAFRETTHRGRYYPPIPLVDRCPGRDGKWCYAPSRVAMLWHYQPDTLNDRRRVAKLRAELWPTVRQRRNALVAA